MPYSYSRGREFESLRGLKLGAPISDSGSDYIEYLKGSVADPGSGAFLTPGPGSGIGLFRIPDLGSQTHIFYSLVTNFWVQSSIIL